MTGKAASTVLRSARAPALMAFLIRAHRVFAFFCTLALLGATASAASSGPLGRGEARPGGTPARSAARTGPDHADSPQGSSPYEAGRKALKPVATAMSATAMVLGARVKANTPSACPCFAPETLVATAEGLRPISQIRVGDLVLAQDPESGTAAYKPVVRVFVTPEKELVELRVAGESGAVETIHATPGHPFWVEGRGWTDAAELVLGDSLSTSTTGAGELLAASSLSDVRTVYNLEVAEFHTYFVGETALWVHNACSCGAGGGQRVAKPFSREKQALVDMAKSDKRSGIKVEDLQAYKDLNKELPDPFPINQVRGPERHSLRTSQSTPGPAQELHGHVGPVDHIPIKESQ